MDACSLGFCGRRGSCFGSWVGLILDGVGAGMGFGVGLGVEFGGDGRRGLGGRRRRMRGGVGSPLVAAFGSMLHLRSSSFLIPGWERELACFLSIVVAVVEEPGEVSLAKEEVEMVILPVECSSSACSWKLAGFCALSPRLGIFADPLLFQLKGRKKSLCKK